MQRPQPKANLPTLKIGDHVEDRDDPESPLLVVGLPLQPANEVSVDGDRTVADCNPGYPATDPVVEVVFPERTTVDVGHLQRYAYPRSRLRRTNAIHAETEDEADV